MYMSHTGSENAITAPSILNTIRYRRSDERTLRRDGRPRPSRRRRTTLLPRRCKQGGDRQGAWPQPLQGRSSSGACPRARCRQD
ncbi:hypothetical protein ACFPRL_16995 [Pseudoclavibacter helvolus]